jgi:anti-anti-sigma regulatory factor
MLRITTATTGTQQLCLRLEGRLVGPWVAEVETTVRQSASPMEAIVLDLSGVHFVDDVGIVLLQTLRTQGVTLQRVTPFIEELLRTRTV